MGKTLARGKRMEEMGFSLHRFFLMIVGRTKRLWEGLTATTMAEC